jgi:hypothetical protein
MVLKERTQSFRYSASLPYAHGCRIFIASISAHARNICDRTRRLLDKRSQTVELEH